MSPAHPDNAADYDAARPSIFLLRGPSDNTLTLTCRGMLMRPRATRKWLNLQRFSAPYLDLNLRLGKCQVVGFHEASMDDGTRDDDTATRLAGLRAAVD